MEYYKWNDVLGECSVATAKVGAAPPTAVATNFVWVESPWPGNGDLYTQFEIGYMPVFGAPGGGNTAAAALQTMVMSIYIAAEARSGYDQVYRGNSGAPFELNTQGDFNQLLRDSRVDSVRNLYYFGHGSPDVIGAFSKKNLPQQNKYLSKSEIMKFLDNKGSPFTTTNRHAFRFVFLDGCKTAAGDMCLSFGIPRIRVMAIQTFANKGLRARAFCGWNDGIVSGFAGAFNQDHSEYIDRLFAGWLTETDPNTGNPIGIGQAANLATQGFAQAQYLVIFGYEGLTLEDTLP